jgi:hypothetical protein
MTDLETQLRDCLSRHATDAATQIDLLSETRARSRQLSRRRGTATVVAIVPITAAVVVGSMSLVGSPAGQDQIHVRPLASPSTSPTPATPPQETGCDAGTVPNLHELGLTGAGGHSQTATIRSLFHRHDQGVNAYYILGGLTPFLVDGQAPAAHSVAMVATTAQHQHVWFILSAPKDDRSDVYAAKFLGCVAEPSP